MNVLEFYNKTHGSYNEVLSRLQNEKIVIKFLKKFLDDNTFDCLNKSINDHNYQDAFRYAHTLKGICLNLGLNDVLEYDCPLTESLRNSKSIDENKVLDQFCKLKQNYNNTINLIKTIEL